MTLDIQAAIHACHLISREIKNYQKNMTIHFIVHHEGQRWDALSLAIQDVAGHPAAEYLSEVFKNIEQSEYSMFLGTIAIKRNILFGLSSQYSMLSLCTINIDQFSSIKDISRYAYHLCWHAVNSISSYTEERSFVRVVTAKQTDSLEKAKTNLKADIFSAVMSYFHDDKEAASCIASMRSFEAMEQKVYHNPECYPFAVAYDTTQFALTQINPLHTARKKIVAESLKITEEIASIFDKTSLEKWVYFAAPAQDMAWRGLSHSDILGAAINTSPKIYVRTIGYMVSEITGVHPSSILKARETHSFFSDITQNQRLHQNKIQDIFDSVIAKNSYVSFLSHARELNERLLTGDIIGWCSYALYEAGADYERAKKSGLDPISCAQDTFDSKKNIVQWKNLRQIGQKIIRMRRQGNIISLSDLKNIVKNIEGMKPLQQAVEKTLSDPHYKENKSYSQ